MGLSRRTWLLLFFLFTAIGCLNTLHFYLDDVTRAHWGTLGVRALEEFTGVYGSFLLLPGIIWLVRRYPITTRPEVSIFIHIAGALGYSFLHTSFEWGSRELAFHLLGLGNYDYGAMPVRYFMELAGDALDYAIAYAVISLIFARQEADNAKIRQADLEARLAEAKLESLQLQLQPHFLFNTLNAISSVMYEDVAKADKMLAQVSEFMRLVLASGGVQSVPLDDELHVERTFVDIMKTRLERHLQLAVHVEEDARDTLVPFMLLQPLLENSIKHGLRGEKSSLELAIDVHRANGSTVIRVSDNGAGYVDGATWGIGLSNTATRLQYMYGDRASFSIERARPQGTVATVTLPSKES